jgi:DMSO/TMAO reductase YedYZ molybdopterin-dependent catalytic subunit
MRKSSIIGVAILLVVIAVFVVAILRSGAGGSKPILLQGVEVTEYQGEKLGSVNDFSENSIKGPQHVDISKYQLKVDGLVKKPASYSYDQLLKKYAPYKKVVQINCVEGWSVKILWEGLLVKDILADSAPSANATTIIFHAYDGYTTSFPIRYINDNNIMMAYKMNDVTMPPERGYPFELVSEVKWGYKWIKWITEIELSDNVDYKGYWESRGYSNDGGLSAGFYSF